VRNPRLWSRRRNDSDAGSAERRGLLSRPLSARDAGSQAASPVRSRVVLIATVRIANSAQTAMKKKISRT